MALELVAFDIETTGFEVSDEVTVVGFAVPMGVRAFADRQTGAQRMLRRRFVIVLSRTSRCRHTNQSVYCLEAVGVRCRSVSGNDVLLVAFNGELWRSGFDLPFLRTRLSRVGVEWPFREMPYADLLPVVTNRFNTTGDDGESRSDLAGVYEVLCDGQYSDLDPFADSAEAVTAYEDGRFGDLVVHNVADVLRTRELGLLSERYCSKSDFKLKSLTPTRHE